MGNHYWNAVNGREFQLPLGASSVPLGKRGALPPPPIPAPGRETTLPRMGGNYENSQWFRSLSAHENTQRGESAYGLPLVFEGLLPRSNAFLPPRRYGFFSLSLEPRAIELDAFLFFFFLIRVLFICLVFDRLSFSCSIFLFKYFRYHTRVKKREHRVDQLYSIFIEIDGMVGEEEFLISLLFFFKNSNFNYISKV